MKDDTKKVGFAAILIMLAGILILKGVNPGFMNRLLGPLSVWDIIWIIVLICILVSSIIKKNFFCIVFSIAFLIFILRGDYGIPYIPAWAIFPPAALIFIGIETLVPKKWHIHTYHDEDGNYKAEFNRERCDRDNSTITESDGCNMEVNFGSTVKYFDMKDLRNSNLECNFGSIRAYYDKAEMADSTAYINIEQNFGETEVYIPKAWKTELKTTRAFGNVSEKGIAEWDGEHTVYINAESNFGKITIYHI